MSQETTNTEAYEQHCLDVISENGNTIFTRSRYIVSERSHFTTKSKKYMIDKTQKGVFTNYAKFTKMPIQSIDITT